ncbi:hypothetical protein ILUMI_25449 [Ignelater luminosus]|uniref:Uncharacterized protein n=1 Tax=Ignelater luminosus TaxID=2038154 RepID=A0A8K0FZX8_IGNLU|nr:hypothetical protein ILUMI_25449 [Ignelater luminosus]
MPKKDLCETCCAYDNAQQEEKEELKNYYDQHLQENELARNEKKCGKGNPNVAVTVYDLQAVMQIPKGDISVYYYKSKLGHHTLHFVSNKFPSELQMLSDKIKSI